MEKERAIRKGALKYVAVLFLQRGIGLLLFALAAGTMADMRGIVNFSLYFIISIIACIVLYRGHRETLRERGQKHENTEKWDKVLLPVYFLLAYYGIYVIAGFGVRFGWEALSPGWMYLGVALYILSGVFTVWPVAENRHFESTVRLQRDRDQSVITTGPYRIVRHPGYMGIVIWAIAVSLLFGTLAVGLTAGVIIVVICVRTYLEDCMLKRELKEYIAYAAKVKRRLIPFIW